MSLRSWFDKSLALSGYAARMGPSWAGYRLKYEWFRRSSHFSRGNARILARARELSDLECAPRNLPVWNRMLKGDSAYVEKAEKAARGQIFAFSNSILDYGREGHIQWNLNPVTGKSAPTDLEWQEIPDFGDLGDIKLVWEASRFPQVLYFVHAFHATGDRKYAEACVSQMLDWCERNPFPFGVNHKCGQETSFRMIAWSLALAHFGDFVAPEARVLIGRNLFVAAARVDLNIEYAARSVRNNHSLSEAVGLILGAFLFPGLRESERWLSRGLAYLASEPAYQIFDDGSYIQHSLNYQRLALDVLSFALLLLRSESVAPPAEAVEGHAKMLAFLRPFLRPNGEVPNYGANDGSLLFPVNAAGYRDFRPSLNLASLVASGSPAYPGFDQVAELLAGASGTGSAEVRRAEPFQAFEPGGYYLFSRGPLFLFLRSHSYRSRPGHCDPHHLDLWWQSENVLCDSGSYSYRAPENLKAQLEGSLGHNVLRVNGLEPMNRVSNFGWSPWVNARVVESGPDRLVSIHDGYRDSLGLEVRREIRVEERGFVVTDSVRGWAGRAVSGAFRLEQLWNTPFSVRLDGQTAILDGAGVQARMSTDASLRLEAGVRSRAYLELQPIQRLVFTAEVQGQGAIVTRVALKGAAG